MKPNTTRRLPARSASDRLNLRRCVLVLGVGASRAGLTACGSESKGATPGSTSTVAKQAGGLDKDVQLEVVNDTDQDVSFTLCRASTSPTWARPLEDSDCPTSDTLKPGGTSTLTSAAVSGTIAGGWRGNNATFLAYNPTVGEPYFLVGEADASSAIGEPQTFDMVEGEVDKVTIDKIQLQLERQGDTDVKVMRVIVVD